MNDKIINTFTVEIYTFKKDLISDKLLLNSQWEERVINNRYYDRYYKPYSEELYQQLLENKKRIVKEVEEDD